MGTISDLTVISALALIVPACGGRAAEQSDEPSVTAQGPSALYAPDARSCVQSLPISEARDRLRPTASWESVSVVEVLYASACSNMGGHFLLARELGGSRRYFDIGNSGCFVSGWPTDRMAFGVVRYTQTAAWFTLGGSGVCLAFPDEGNDPQGTDSHTQSLAVFASRDAAEAFAASIR